MQHKRYIQTIGVDPDGSAVAKRDRAGDDRDENDGGQDRKDAQASSVHFEAGSNDLAGVDTVLPSVLIANAAGYATGSFAGPRAKSPDRVQERAPDRAQNQVQTWAQTWAQTTIDDDSVAERGGCLSGKISQGRWKQASSAPAGPLPEIGERVHHYEIIREIGRGGMGVVYLGRDLRLDRRVAIKFVRKDRAGLLERFLLEARTTARCQHENIVVIHDIGQYRGNPFMVLEYLRGQSLHDLLDGQTLSCELTVEIMIPVLRALERAHEYNIVHRDLKPGNIFLTDSGVVKVLDFGIAKQRDERAAVSSSHDPLPERNEGSALTRAGNLVGTMPYMSPEQLAGLGVDPRTDLWAVGIVMHEMLTGHHPLDPVNLLKIQSIANVDKPLLQAGRFLDRSSPLAPIIEGCLRKNRLERTSSANELLTQLNQLSAHHCEPMLSEKDGTSAGLAAFQQADADRFYGRFYGRTHEIVQATSQLRKQPLLTCVGPSGSGKSSLVRNGVIAAQERSGEGRRSPVIRPGHDLSLALASTLGQLKLVTAMSSSSLWSGVARLAVGSSSGSSSGSLGRVTPDAQSNAAASAESSVESGVQELLWRDDIAEYVWHWQAPYPGGLPDGERAYLHAVPALADHKRRRKQKLFAGIIAILTFLLVISVLGLWRIRAANLEASERAEELAVSLVIEKQARSDALEARRAAEEARSDTKDALAVALREAERAHKAQRRAEESLEQAREAAARAKVAEARAKAQRNRARRAERLATASWERAAEQFVRAEENVEKKQALINRPVGKVKYTASQ